MVSIITSSPHNSFLHVYTAMSGHMCTTTITDREGGADKSSNFGGIVGGIIVAIIAVLAIVGIAVVVVCIVR